MIRRTKKWDTLKLASIKTVRLGSRHSSMVLSALPSCSLRFESQAHHLHFFQFVLLKLIWEKNKNKQKEAGIGTFFLKKPVRYGIRSSQLGIQKPTSLRTNRARLVNVKAIMNVFLLWRCFLALRSVYVWTLYGGGQLFQRISQGAKLVKNYTLKPMLGTIAV